MVSSSITMPSIPRLAGHVAAIWLCCVLLLHQASALTISYCSSLNTASTNANSSIYQSNGLCHDFCLQRNFALAVLQDSDCWCSNFVPGTTTSVSSCSNQCPGYPLDLCGGQGLFAYIALSNAPSGTKGASNSAAATSNPPSSTSSVLSSSILQTTTSPSSSSSTWTPTPVLSVETVTGEVRTVTFVPTSPADSQSSTSGSSSPFQSTSKSGGLSTGQAVGLTVGLVALVAIIGVIIFFCVRRRRQQAMFDNASGGNSTLNHSPQRTISQNSSYMLRSDGRNVVEGWTGEEAENPAGRGSRLLPVDPRLDPFAPVYQRGDANKSHESLQTIHDNHDYSRRVHPQKTVLSVTNPD